MFAENVSGRPSTYPGHGRELADGYGEVVAYFRRQHQDAVALLEAADARRIWRPPLPDPRRRQPAGLEMARSMVEHEIHHRGQIYIYLGMLGVPTPPLCNGLTEEEVKRAAQPNQARCRPLPVLALKAKRGGVSSGVMRIPINR